MLTEQEIINAFMNKIGSPPEPEQIEAYKDTTIENLERILNRRLALEQNLDPTLPQRIAENYYQYLYATPEEQSVWNFPDPSFPINNSE